MYIYTYILISFSNMTFFYFAFLFLPTRRTNSNCVTTNCSHPDALGKASERLRQKHRLCGSQMHVDKLDMLCFHRETTRQAQFRTCLFREYCYRLLLTKESTADTSQCKSHKRNWEASCTVKQYWYRAFSDVLTAFCTKRFRRLCWVQDFVPVSTPVCQWEASCSQWMRCAPQLCSTNKISNMLTRQPRTQQATGGGNRADKVVYTLSCLLSPYNTKRLPSYGAQVVNPTAAWRTASALWFSWPVITSVTVLLTVPFYNFSKVLRNPTKSIV